MNEPITDHMRAALDGHIVMSRELAARGHHPAIDVTHSVSRLLSAVTTRAEQQIVKRAVEIMARVEDARDLLDMGAYHPGSNPDLDEALTCIKPLMGLLIQEAHESAPRREAMAMLTEACAVARPTASGDAA